FPAIASCAATASSPATAGAWNASANCCAVNGKTERHPPGTMPARFREIRHETRRPDAAGDPHHAVRQVRRPPDRRPARSLPGLVRPQRLSQGRDRTTAATDARDRPQRAERAAGTVTGEERLTSWGGRWRRAPPATPRHTMSPLRLLPSGPGRVHG